MTRTIAPAVIPFGWCLDGNHDRCRVTYITGLGVERRCVCDCHEAVASSLAKL